MLQQLMKRAGVIPLPELRIVRRQAESGLWFPKSRLETKCDRRVRESRSPRQHPYRRRLGRRRVGTGGDDRTRSEIALASRTYGDLDDLLLDRVLHQLRLVMDVELAH